MAETTDRKHEHAGLEFSRVPRKSKSSAESGRLQEGSRGLVLRLADDRRTDAPYLIHIQRKLNMREAAATAHSQRLGRKTGLSGD